jgi:hypothetical protein
MGPENGEHVVDYGDSRWSGPSKLMESGDAYKWLLAQYGQGKGATGT